MALSKIDVANMVENQMPQANLADNINFRNIIINGDMSIAQRGTSTTGITASSPTAQYPTVDRMQFQYDDAGTWTVTQDNTVPTGQGFAKSFKLDCTTAKGTLDADSFLTYAQQIEGQNLQYLKKGTSSAESLTLSFWVRSNKTGTYIVSIYDHDNSRTISKSYTINSASTWEKKTITYDGDTTGTLDNDNASSFEINFWLAAGTNFTSGTLQTSWGTNTAANRAVGQVNLADSTSNEWYITGVQLEAGTTASDFEFLPHDVNLNRCLRYFQGINGAINMHQTSNASAAIVHFSLQQNMRATPTMAIANQTANIGVFGGNNDAINPSISGAKSTSTYGSCEYTHGQNFHSDSAGESQILIYNDFGTTFFTMDAEL